MISAVAMGEGKKKPSVSPYVGDSDRALSSLGAATVCHMLVLCNVGPIDMPWRQSRKEKKHVF